MKSRTAKPTSRRTQTGGYARGEETRARIIEAALKVFGEEGYARASTRRIADVAGVMPPALQYYFESKEGLHRACAQQLVDLVSERLREARDIAARALETGEAEVAAEALCDLLDRLLVETLTTERPLALRRFLARAQLDGDGPAFGVIRDELFAPMAQLCSNLVTAALEKPEPDDEARLLATLLRTQLAAFGPNRDASLIALGWQEIDKPRLQLVRQALRRTVLGALAAKG